ncbi:phosphoribosylanthranilate isomerase [Pseudoxanthomonas sp. z9]|uniref:phosphoribosylanthranilate isomerase n=1 Tax=Pseudoxanthomonas sp. z9 TaxID=2584942 RepID=UPI0011444D7B|nr:phosphoribosylanthranilate isomerase [Pseudoxanthomonas sp. z9]
MPTRIKFCGLTRAEDVRTAVELGVDYVGLVFAPRSPRRLLIGQARMLRDLVPEEIAVVALMMDNSADDVEGVIEHVRPDLLQFHGGEEDAFCAGFAVPFLKAIAMGGAGESAFSAIARYPSAHGFLFDGHAAGEQGGSGKRFDWKQMPQATERPYLLAGGLSVDNVAVAVRTAHPWGVDISSGIESAPGVKDAEKMRQFVDAVRYADQRAQQSG